MSRIRVRREGVAQPTSGTARALAARVGVATGLPATEVAHHLGLGAHAVRKLARRDIDPRASTALRRRLALEERASRRDRSKRNAG